MTEYATYRKEIKRLCYRDGLIVTKGDAEVKSSYEMYYDFTEKVNRIPSHRILAINRGEKEDFLKVKMEKPEEQIIAFIERDIIKRDNKKANGNQYEKILQDTILDSFKRLIEPSIEREIRSDLTEKAEEQAIKVFGKNAKQLLMQPPIKEMTVLGFDPAYRTGCKIAVIDSNGKVLPIEIKSGKDYDRHNALSNVMKTKEYALSEAFVFCNDNIKIVNKTIYYPIYMLMFLQIPLINTCVMEEIF